MQYRGLFHPNQPTSYGQANPPVKNDCQACLARGKMEITKTNKKYQQLFYYTTYNLGLYSLRREH